MHGAKKLYVRGWRSVLVLSLVAVPLGIIGNFTAPLLTVIPPTAVALSGTHYSSVNFVPHNQQLGNASVQAIAIETPDPALNEIVTSAMNAKIQSFEAGLPPTAAVSGFFHQLRIIPRIDYSSKNLVSITLQIDEYHPTGVIATQYVSWLADAGKVEQPELDGPLAAQLAKLLHAPEKDLEQLVGTPIAMGLLPNYKVRLYSSGPLAPYVTKPFRDVSLSLLPEMAKNYHVAYYATYPDRPNRKMQASLDTNYTRAVARATGPADCARESCVALTFDDGPDPVITPRVLDILHAGGVSATFFELGNRVLSAPELSKRVAAEGHEIENHTFAHPDLVKLHNPALIRKQIDETHAALAGLGIEAKFLRPPYGSVDDTVRATANMPIILWNVDAQEWRPGTTPASMAASIVAQTRPGAIILMHDSRQITSNALPLVIEQLKARNFRFVTVEQLLQIDGASRGEFSSR